jgi:hypothetical protein
MLTGTRTPRPLLVRIVLPGVPWYIAVPCNVLAAGALAFLILDPHDNLPWALALLVPAVIWWRNQDFS